MNINKSKGKRFLAAAVASLIIVTCGFSSVMTGCNFSENGTEATAAEIIGGQAEMETKAETTAAATEKSESKTSKVSSESSESSKAKESSAASKASESSGSSGQASRPTVQVQTSRAESSQSSASSRAQSSAAQSSKSQSSQSSQSRQSSQSSKSSQPSQSSQSSQSSRQSSSGGSGQTGSVLKIGSQSFNVGDTVSCMVSLNGTEYFENYQGELTFDGRYLKVVSAKLRGEAAAGGIYNARLENRVPFNGVNLDGYDYSDGGEFLEVVFEVVASGSTSVDVNWEIITGLSGADYARDGKLIGGFTDSKTYTKQ